MVEASADGVPAEQVQVKEEVADPTLAVDPAVEPAVERGAVSAVEELEDEQACAGELVTDEVDAEVVAGPAKVSEDVRGDEQAPTDLGGEPVSAVADGPATDNPATDNPATDGSATDGTVTDGGIGGNEAVVAADSLMADSRGGSVVACEGGEGGGGDDARAASVTKIAAVQRGKMARAAVKKVGQGGESEEDKNGLGSVAAYGEGSEDGAAGQGYELPGAAMVGEAAGTGDAGDEFGASEGDGGLDEVGFADEAEFDDDEGEYDLGDGYGDFDLLEAPEVDADEEQVRDTYSEKIYGAVELRAESGRRGEP